MRTWSALSRWPSTTPHRCSTLYASHDDGLSLLRGHAVAQRALHLDIRFCGSVDAIAALNEGRCTLAGFHMPRAAAAGRLAQRTYQPLLQPGRHKLIGFARAQPGPDGGAGQSAAARVAGRRGARDAHASSTARWAAARGCCATNCSRRRSWRRGASRATRAPSLRMPRWRRRSRSGRGRCGPGHRGRGARARPGLRAAAAGALLTCVPEGRAGRSRPTLALREALRSGGMAGAAGAPGPATSRGAAARCSACAQQLPWWDLAAQEAADGDAGRCKGRKPCERRRAVVALGSANQRRAFGCFMRARVGERRAALHARPAELRLRPRGRVRAAPCVGA